MSTNNRKIEIQLIHITNVHEDLECSIRVLVNDEETLPFDISVTDRLHIGAMLLRVGKKFIRNSVEAEQNSVKRKNS